MGAARVIRHARQCTGCTVPPPRGEGVIQEEMFQ